MADGGLSLRLELNGSGPARFTASCRPEAQGTHVVYTMKHCSGTHALHQTPLVSSLSPHLNDTGCTVKINIIMNAKGVNIISLI